MYSSIFMCSCLNIISIFFQDHGTGALVISALLDFLTFALCAPYSETSEGQQFDMLLEMVASNGRTLFKLFQVRGKTFCSVYADSPSQKMCFAFL